MALLHSACIPRRGSKAQVLREHFCHKSPPWSSHSLSMHIATHRGPPDFFISLQRARSPCAKELRLSFPTHLSFSISSSQSVKVVQDRLSYVQKDPSARSLRRITHPPHHSASLPSLHGATSQSWLDDRKNQLSHCTFSPCRRLFFPRVNIAILKVVSKPVWVTSNFPSFMYPCICFYTSVRACLSFDSQCFQHPTFIPSLGFASTFSNESDTLIYETESSVLNAFARFLLSHCSIDRRHKNR